MPHRFEIFITVETVLCLALLFVIFVGINRNRK